MKIYIDKNGYHLKVQVGYEKGGINFLSGETGSRGYYLYVTPVTIEKSDDIITVEKMLLFNGGKKLLLEVNRQSEKAYRKACAMFNENQEFIERMDKKYSQAFLESVI
jgi:hypothetical protein